jgi:RNA polymerase sigma-70 factor, ECF subfamily
LTLDSPFRVREAPFRMITKLQEFAAPSASPARGRDPVASPDQAPIDLDLMRQVRSGDTSAFEAVVERYWASTALYAQHMVGDADRASDIAQEAFARLWQRRTEWEPTGSVRVWLLRTARNLIASEARRQSVRLRWAAVARWENPARPSTPLQDMERAELRAAIQRAVEALPARRREVFTLFHIQGLSYREIAEIMDIRPQTVANYLQAAIADLRRLLSTYFPALTPGDATER